jgi:hypothetical protein
MCALGIPVEIGISGPNVELFGNDGLPRRLAQLDGNRAEDSVGDTDQHEKEPDSVLVVRPQLVAMSISRNRGPRAHDEPLASPHFTLPTRVLPVPFSACLIPLVTWSDCERRSLSP